MTTIFTAVLENQIAQYITDGVSNIVPWFDKSLLKKPTLKKQGKDYIVTIDFRHDDYDSQIVITFSKSEVAIVIDSLVDKSVAIYVPFVINSFLAGGNLVSTFLQLSGEEDSHWTVRTNSMTVEEDYPSNKGQVERLDAIVNMIYLLLLEHEIVISACKDSVN